MLFPCETASGGLTEPGKLDIITLIASGDITQRWNKYEARESGEIFLLADGRQAHSRPRCEGTRRKLGRRLRRMSVSAAGKNLGAGRALPVRASKSKKGPPNGPQARLGNRRQHDPAH